ATISRCVTMTPSRGAGKPFASIRAGLNESAARFLLALVDFGIGLLPAFGRVHVHLCLGCLSLGSLVRMHQGRHPLLALTTDSRGSRLIDFSSRRSPSSPVARPRLLRLQP